MNKEELKRIYEVIRERFNVCDIEAKAKGVKLEAKDFNFSVIDEKISFEQNLKLVEDLLPKTNKMIEKEEEENIRLRQQKDLDLITADSEELELIYKNPISMIEKVCDGKSKGFLLHGETSLGKSYKVKEVLKRKEKKPMDSKGEGDYHFVSGHITPMKFYEQLYNCRDKIIVFDDCDILGNIIIINMIKAGLNENSGNIIHYHTSSSKMTIPSSFEFKGQMIILLNKVPKTCEHLRAITSRIQSWELKFTREQIVKIIHLIAHKGIGLEFNDTTLDERVMIAKWLTEKTSLATTNLNIRLFIQAVSYYKWDKSYSWKKDWKELISSQINTDNHTTLIIQGCSDDEWVVETGLSIRTLQRKKKAINEREGRKKSWCLNTNQIKTTNDTSLGYVNG